MGYFSLDTSRIIFLLFLFSFFQSHAQYGDIEVRADKYISVTEIDDDVFLVENLTDIKLGVYSWGSGRTIYIKPKEHRHISSEKLGNSNLLRIYVETSEYERIAKRYKYQYAKETVNQIWFKAYDNQVKKGIKEKKQKDEEKFNVEDRFLEGLYRVLSYGTKRSRGRYKEEIARKFKDYTNLFVATRHSGNLKGGTSVKFIPYNLDNAEKNTTKAKDYQVNKKSLFYFGIGTSGASPGDNWKSEISYYAIYGRQLWKGFRWSARTQTSLYAFLRYDSDAYILVKDEKDFFVGREYIENANQDFFSLRSDADVALRTNHPSAGIMFRTYRFNGLSLDLGAGYQFAEWNKLKFRDVEDDESPTSNSPFVDSEFKNVVDYEGTDLYGMVNLGWIFEVPSKRGKGHTSLSFLISSRFWQRELIVNEDFEIYEDQNGSLERINVTDESTLFYTVNFSMGFLF